MRVEVAPGRFREAPQDLEGRHTGPPPPLWAYGVTTVPSRRDTLLPATLRSLAAVGFDRPWLFVDGADMLDYAWPSEGPKPAWADLPATYRSPAVGVVGSWILALWELWARFPTAERYALFQDDLLAVRGLRDYLDAVPWPPMGYLNLMTFLDNEAVVASKSPGWHRAQILHQEHRKLADGNIGWQRGRSALALVFSAEAVELLLSQRPLVHKVRAGERGQRRIDGAIVNAMNSAGWSEYIHNPSLVTHTGNPSTLGNLPYPPPRTWPGETWDARTLLAPPKGGPRP